MSYYRFAFRLALVFFLAGTFLLFLFYLEPSLQRAVLAYQFTIVAIVVNWLFALFLLFTFLRQGMSLVHLAKSLGVMAINIPVGILYARTMIWLLSFARITLINVSTNDITEIELRGCESKRLENLSSGSSTTAWIKIKNECDVSIRFLSGGQIQERVVVRGLSEGKGFKMSYELK